MGNLVMARIEQLLADLDETERLRNSIKEELKNTVESATLSEADVASLYWRSNEVPVRSLSRASEGHPRDVLRIVREYPYWSWRCQRCGDEVFITSRSDLLDHQKNRVWEICSDCRKKDLEDRQDGWREQEDQRKEYVFALRQMLYKDYLKTDHWQTLRKQALKRATYLCQVCYRSRVLHVHHRTYERRGEELASDLIVLCDECHALYHHKGLLATEPA